MKNTAHIGTAVLALLILFCLCCPGQAFGDEKKEKPTNFQFNLAPNKGETSTVVKILVMMTLLSLIPAILFTMTSFTRILIVLSFARQSFGVQNLPPNPILIGLALFVTIFVMTPVWEDIYTKAYQPYQQKKIASTEATARALRTIRKFMFKHTREKDLALMLHLRKKPLPKNEDEIPTPVLIPAFVISELTVAFQMGFLILLPFLVVDIVVASTLLSMGMMMLPPVIIAVPFKVLLFILVDGWHLVVKTLVMSYA